MKLVTCRHSRMRVRHDASQTHVQARVHSRLVSDCLLNMRRRTRTDRLWKRVERGDLRLDGWSKNSPTDGPTFGCLSCVSCAVMALDLDACIEKLLNKQLLVDTLLKEICERTKELLMMESNVVHISAPVTVVGDIHGCVLCARMRV